MVIFPDKFAILETPPVHRSPLHQIKKWRFMADWWSGKIVPHIVNTEKAEHAVRQVLVWAQHLHKRE